MIHWFEITSRLQDYNINQGHLSRVLCQVYPIRESISIIECALNKSYKKLHCNGCNHTIMLFGAELKLETVRHLLGADYGY